MNGEQSRWLFDRSRAIIPGGVNSPVRACKSVVQNTLFLPFNDMDAVEGVMAEKGEQIAGIIVEPVEI